MEANHTPCSIEVPADGRLPNINVPFRRLSGGCHWHNVPRRDFSSWLTADALDAFDPDGREAALFLWAVAQAAAVNNELERRRYGRRPE